MKVLLRLFINQNYLVCVCVYVYNTLLCTYALITYICYFRILQSQNVCITESTSHIYKYVATK